MPKCSKTIAVLATLFVWALSLVPTDVQASCGSSNRLSMSNADCVSGGKHNWKHYGFPRGRAWAELDGSCYHLLSVAPDRYDELWVKVDRKSASDWTWKLTNVNKREKSGHATIRGVYCCKDKGICNMSDVVNAGSCKSRFSDDEHGVAGHEYCAVTGSSASGLQCTLNLTCLNLAGGSETSTLRANWHMLHYYEIEEGIATFQGSGVPVENW